MNNKSKAISVLLKIFKSLFFISLLVANIIMMSFIYKSCKGDAESANVEITNGGDNQELLAALQQPVNKDEKEESDTDTEEVETDDIVAEAEEIPTSPFTDQEILLYDIYAESGSMAEFKVFDKDAVSYEWEIYDLSIKDWKVAEHKNVSDELLRNISVLTLSATPENHELMVRCKIHYENKEDVIQTASLYVMKDKVKEIQIDDIFTNANTYISTGNIPVKVTYTDDTSETITGLSGLYFISSEEFKEYSTAVSGNRVETTTMVATECNYYQVSMGEQDITIRYHPARDEAANIEKTVKIVGEDLQAPEIESVEISSFEISQVDDVVPVNVTITAEDNETPYPYLEYAFVIAGRKPNITDWIKKPSFEIDIKENGTYIAYAKDSAGNISEMEKEIIAVDTKAPNIKAVSLLNDAEWCKSNTIAVDATDTLGMQYRYLSKANGTDSDWITFCEYSVEVNGTWVIQVKDAAGNISETEIEVNNIDKVAPVIRSINVK